MKRYLLKLTPLNKFFFGGENTFGIEGNDNYFIKSEKFPQQTSILGLIRQVILEQNHFLKGQDGFDYGTAKSLVGGIGFTISENQEITSILEYGKIHKISPVFLMKGNKRYFPCPFDYGFVLGSKIGKVAFSPTNSFNNEAIPILFNYDPKVGVEKSVISEVGERIMLDKIFLEEIQAGVWKTAQGEEDDQGYYKQHFYRLEKEWCFACYLEIDEYININSCHVNFGKEASPFLFELSSEGINQEQSIEVQYLPVKLKLNYTAGNWKKITLLSDTFVENSIYENVFFALTETKDFRFIQTPLSKVINFHNITENKEKTNDKTKSTKFNLIEKGSVLWVEEQKLTTVTQQLENKPFQQIGFNYYIITESNNLKI